MTTMMDSEIPQIAHELQLTEGQVEATIGLLDDGGTVPFIARYRKESTGSLDEVAITGIRDRLAQLRELRDRREAILASLGKRGLLSEELRKAVLSAETMAVLEDTYLPHRPKRRTRAAIARERGLEPLALRLWGQDDFDVTRAADEYVNPQAGVENASEALNGARDIIGEWVSEDPTARKEIRELFWSQGAISAAVASGKESAAIKYRDYFAWQEPVARAPSHRFLAMLRGEKETLLSVRIAPPASAATAILERIFVGAETEAAVQIRLAIRDRYRPLLESPMEREVRKAARVRAEDTATGGIRRQSPRVAAGAGPRPEEHPGPGSRVSLRLQVGVPGPAEPSAAPRHRLSAARGTGRGGSRRENTPAVPSVPNRGHRRGLWHRRPRDRSLSEDPGVGPQDRGGHGQRQRGLGLLSVGGGASRIPGSGHHCPGAVSIGRRLMDPLAELVKIDPKSIGVGQYQHDVDQKALKERLDDVVISCVNQVGVD